MIRDFLSKANKHKRSVLTALTRNLETEVKAAPPGLDIASIRRILIVRPNHRLGNTLMITPLVQEISNLLPCATVDLFVKGNTASVVFRNYANIGRLVALPKKHFSRLHQYLYSWLQLRSESYDMVINIDAGSSSGRMATAFAKGRFRINGNLPEQEAAHFPDYAHLAKKPVYNLRYFLSAAEHQAVTRLPIAVQDILLSEPELKRGREAVRKLAEDKARVIALFTHATGAKKHSTEFWERVYRRIQAEFPDHAIIEVLPVENISQLSFEAPCYYSAELRELASVIANCRLFIGADSGIMHLASASGIPVVGLFNVTSPQKYKPYGNGSHAFETGTGTDEALFQAISTLLKQELSS